MNNSLCLVQMNTFHFALLIIILPCSHAQLILPFKHEHFHSALIDMKLPMRIPFCTVDINNVHSGRSICMIFIMSFSHEQFLFFHVHILNHFHCPVLLDIFLFANFTWPIFILQCSLEQLNFHSVLINLPYSQYPFCPVNMKSIHNALFT